MKVEMQNNEVLIRFKEGTKLSKIQTILDYLRYEELTYNSTATDEAVTNLVNEAKSGRWGKIQKEIGLED